jgi:hypothetical protein
MLPEAGKAVYGVLMVRAVMPIPSLNGPLQRHIEV